MNANEALNDERWSVEADTLCSLLGNELSACETYRTAIHSIERGEENPALSLRCLYRSHRRFADEHRALVRGIGGCPVEPIDAWGVWTGVRERVASMSGRTSGPAALRVLRHGERTSLELARGALDELEGPPAGWVRDRLIRGVEANLDLLDAMESFVGDRPASPPAT